jgi:hypothetical protein
MGWYSGAGMKEIAYDLGFLDIATSAGFSKHLAGKFQNLKKCADARWVSAGSK